MKVRLRDIGLVALLLTAGPASAETTECTEITSVPAIIETQGIYCFTQNLGTAITIGNAITINTNNVTIDFNGFKLGGLAAGPDTIAVGVYALNRQNITLKNANIRGFRYGVRLGQSNGSSSGHVIEDSLFDGNTEYAVYVAGNGVVVRNNRVVNTDSTPPTAPVFGYGGTDGGLTSSGTVSEAGAVSMHGEAPSAGNGGPVIGIVGIYLVDSLITGNLVSNTIAFGGSSYGIDVANSRNVEVSRNTVGTVFSNSSSARGIYIFSSSEIGIRDNNLFDGESGGSVAYGIDTGGTNVANIACLNNMVIDFTSGQTQGCDAETGTFPAAP